MVKQLSLRRLIVACGAAVGSVIGGCTSAQNSAEKPQTALHAHLLVGTAIVRITNDDTFAWQNVRIELNPAVGVDSTEYYGMQLSSWPAGTMKTLKLGDFTKDGAHYNPASEKVNELVIRCDVPGSAGTGFYDATLNT